MFATLSQWLSRPGRIPIGSCQARARRRRGLIRVLVRSYIETSLRWLQTGCLRLSETPLGRSLRLLASRAANNRAAARSLGSPPKAAAAGLRGGPAGMRVAVPPDLSFHTSRVVTLQLSWRRSSSVSPRRTSWPLASSCP